MSTPSAEALVLAALCITLAAVLAVADDSQALDDACPADGPGGAAISDRSQADPGLRARASTARLRRGWSSLTGPPDVVVKLA
jgi:hypothetical protein